MAKVRGRHVNFKHYIGSVQSDGAGVEIDWKRQLTSGNLVQTYSVTL
jgi:hypothetical protein